MDKEQTESNSISLKINSIINKIAKKIDILENASNGRKRVISALVMLPIALIAIYVSKTIFFILMCSVTMIMTAEWCDMIKKMDDQARWRKIGFFYILIPVVCVINIRLSNPNILLWMFSVIIATDTFAYYAGKSIGGPKLAPKTSPNKTWSGLFGGILASMVIGAISSFMFAGGSVVFFAVLSGILAVLEQASDLMESKFKRIFGVKDSGNIIPGHGGVLDRLDGMMLVAPVVMIISIIFASKFIAG